MRVIKYAWFCIFATYYIMMVAHKPVQVAAWLKNRLPESNLDFSGHRTLQTQVVHIKGNVVGQQV